MAHLSRRTRSDRRLRLRQHGAQRCATNVHALADTDARPTALTLIPASTFGEESEILSVALDATQLKRGIDRALQAAVTELARIAQNESHPEHAIPVETSRAVIMEKDSFDREDLSAYFALQAETMASVLKQAYLLINEEKLSRQDGLLPLLQAIASAGEPLLVAAANSPERPSTPHVA